MYSSVPYAQQVPVYFKKFARINSRESAWKYVLFAGIIGAIIGAVCTDGFDPNGVFITVSGCIWLGIFNTIQCVCKEHDIINSEYRQGMNIASFITAHVLWQLVLCFIQALLMFLILLPFGMFKGIDFGDAILIFMFFYLLVFCSAILGLMVSCLVGNPTTAMTIMPFLLIVQLLLGDYPIEMKDSGETLTYITFSRWGMRAVGSISGAQVPKTNSQGIPEGTENLFARDFGNTGGALLICLGIAALFVIISYVALQARNKKT